MKSSKIFFCHIPKTGGMALRYYLLNQFAGQKVCLFDDWRTFLQTDRAELSSYDLFQGHFPLDMARFMPSVKRIAFFREPVARTISLLRHIRRDSNFHYLHHAVAGKTLEQLLDDPYLVSQLSNHQTAYMSGRVVVSSLLGGNSGVTGFGSDIGEVLTEPDIHVALENIGQLDFIGLTEHMDESLRRMSDKFSFHPPITFGKRNEASPDDGHNENHLSARSIDRIRTLNELDLQLYEAVKARFLRERPAPSNDQLVKQSLSRRGMVLNQFLGEFDLSGFMPGSNWYEPERDGPSAPAYRWSGPLDVSTIEWPLDARSHRSFQMSLFPLADDDLNASVTVHCDGVAVPAMPSQSDEYTRYNVSLVPNRTALEKGFHQIVLTHKRRAAKVAPGGDLRNLRFGLSDVRVVRYQQF